MSDFFNTTADVLDLRDVVEAGRQYLETYEDVDSDADDRTEASEALSELDKVCSDLGLAHATYTEVIDSLGEYADDEPTLIAEDYFQTYAQELAEEIGAVPSDLQWPVRHIDWEAAANELRADYNEVTLEGHAYYIRAV